jgi:hypothetical protein
MADSARSATPPLPMTTSILVSLIREFASSPDGPSTLDRFSVPMIVRPQAYVWALDVQYDDEHELVLNGEVRR